MNASSESGLWATWIVVIKSLRGRADRGERGIDVVLMEEVLGERGGALGWRRRAQRAIECAGSRVVLLQARDARGEDQPEEVGRALLQDGVGLGARERGVAPHLAQPTEVVPLVEIERVEHLVRGTGHREEGANGVLPSRFVLRHDAIVEPLGA